ncbi:Exo-endo-phos-2 domain containing protein [Pyrenophora tritici-repentis]|nr:Exo-endo-phos-2 domain containing protein [Pyrenophora tritici-repentis]
MANVETPERAPRSAQPPHTRSEEPESPINTDLRGNKRRQRAHTRAEPSIGSTAPTSYNQAVSEAVRQRIQAAQKATNLHHSIITDLATAVDRCLGKYTDPDGARVAKDLQQKVLRAINTSLITPLITPPNSGSDSDTTHRSWADIEANGYRILNVYRQPQNDSTFQYLTALTPPRNCLIGGDLNARHELFEPGSTSANRGAEIARWATQNDIPYIGEAVIRGRAAGNRRIPRSKVQRVAQLLPATPRNVLASPHFSYGSRQDPTQGQGKDIAAQNFTIWWESLGQETITVFSDGSKQQINGTKVVTYGYAIYQGQAAVATGQGLLNALSHVFDAEAIGACRGLKHALQLSLPSQREIVLCIDSTSVI